jgi:hypothetical protein
MGTPLQNRDEAAPLWTMSAAALVAFAMRGEREAVAAGLELLRRERMRLSRARRFAAAC